MNPLINTFYAAYVNLIAAKLRSFLALLGVLVGSAAVVALISSGELATKKALDQFKNLGTDLLSLSLYPKEESGKKNTKPLTLEDWYLLKARLPQIMAIAPYAVSYQPLSFKGQSFQGAIVGLDRQAANILRIELAKGYLVSSVHSFEQYCVIGARLADQLQPLSYRSLIGQQISLGKLLYTIIGIAKPWKENSFFNEDINQAVMIPINGIRLINADAKVTNAVIKLRSSKEVDETAETVKQIMAMQAPDFNLFIRSAKQIIASMETQGKIFTLLLGVIGGISLLVGGIGIMNIMLVAVNERKKEIGVRKAIGATNSQIKTLFLAEAILLSLVGGISGSVLGIILTVIIAYFSQWSFELYFLPLILGFIISVGIGTFFGYYPAKRAAELDPIVSLRND